MYRTKHIVAGYYRACANTLCIGCIYNNTIIILRLHAAAGIHGKSLSVVAVNAPKAILLKKSTSSRSHLEQMSRRLISSDIICKRESDH